ncbi:hypothetical protein PCASD_22222 [Puccinia coronata f. sp. avenae]|uniref:Uncharacterized protein n=1 Tax=Puccinia coronata f. sp. avenae TaxID=200324 RepID=A0A2N5T7Q6_9BASI|nr:hypothetical protein PCASD_22222 [Puccinia coronata f. sp. avenae]
MENSGPINLNNTPARTKADNTQQTTTQSAVPNQGDTKQVLTQDPTSGDQTATPLDEILGALGSTTRKPPNSSP